MTVAIVGLSPSTRHLIPADSEIWGLPWDYELAPRMSRMFEMHDRGLLEHPDAMRPDDYWERLSEAHCPVYMQRHYSDIPKSVPYPLEDLERTIFKGFPRWDQTDWYNSSPAYMIALAIYAGHDFGLYGIDVLDESEFQTERNCLEFLIGMAMGRGLNVFIPEGPTALCKFRGEGIKLGRMEPTYIKRYGYVS